MTAIEDTFFFEKYATTKCSSKEEIISSAKAGINKIPDIFGK